MNPPILQHHGLPTLAGALKQSLGVINLALAVALYFVHEIGHVRCLFEGHV
jgi:hypothetical protein